MQIDMTEQEYRDLLDVLHMADWMMHAHETEKNPASEPYDRIIQKLYGLAESMGQSELIQYDADTREYFPTRAFDDAAASREFVEHFIEETFWDELVHRLTDRDLSRKLGSYDHLDALSMKERFSLESPIIEKYSQEFEARGLERLGIVDQPASGIDAPVQTHD